MLPCVVVARFRLLSTSRSLRRKARKVVRFAAKLPARNAVTGAPLDFSNSPSPETDQGGLFVF